MTCVLMSLNDVSDTYVPSTNNSILDNLHNVAFIILCGMKK